MLDIGQIVILTPRPKGPLIGLIEEMGVLVIDLEFFFWPFFSLICELCIVKPIICP